MYYLAKMRFNDISSDVLHANVKQSIEELETLLATSFSSPEDTKTLARGLQNLLMAASMTMGECRVQAPFASLYPVIDANGNLKWCCTHNPSHCAP
jgi:hypothetical protein